MPALNQNISHNSPPKLVKLWPEGDNRYGFMNRQKAESWSLVLLSVNISHRMIQSHRGWEILVNELDAVAARHHLEKYEGENSQWPPKVLSNHSNPEISRWTLFICALIIGLYSVTGPWTDSNWFEQGAIRSGLIKEDFQWWRLVTALTLHADVVHLLGNVCLGGAIITFLASLTGSGLAWMLTFSAGIMGNILNVLFHASSHNSVGFSTSVFGAIGVLCGIRALRQKVLDVLLPLGAGLGLLAMLGAEGARTDLGAHLWGMGSGMALGAMYHILDPKQKYLHNSKLQNCAAMLVIALSVMAWLIALR